MGTLTPGAAPSGDHIRKIIERQIESLDQVLE